MPSIPGPDLARIVLAFILTITTYSCNIFLHFNLRSFLCFLDLGDESRL